VSKIQEDGGRCVSAIGRELRERVDSARNRATRVTPGTLLVRGAAFAFTIAALLVAFPAQVLTVPTAAALLVVLAAVPALVPRTRFTTAVVLVAVFGWLASTTAYTEPVTLTRLVTLACLLYLVHTTTALAAVLPYDTVLSPLVLANWLARTAVVLALTTVFAVAAVTGVRATGGRAYLVASISGLLLVAALAALLAALRRRRS
jgi:hypothetical protein